MYVPRLEFFTKSRFSVGGESTLITNIPSGIFHHTLFFWGAVGCVDRLKTWQLVYTFHPEFVYTLGMKTKTLLLRLSEEELAGWKARAKASGLKVSEWVRRQANRDVTVPLEEAEVDPMPEKD